VSRTRFDRVSNRVAEILYARTVEKPLQMSKISDMRRSRGKAVARTPAVAAVSAPFDRDLDRCLQRIELTIARARARGADLVVFPEAALGGYLYEPIDPLAPDDVGPPPALRRDGPELARLIRAAGDTVVCVGYTEAGEDGVYSSAACVSGDGLLGHHRKVHLPPAERGHYVPGSRFDAFDTPVGRVGMLVCYDKVFPESARELSLSGAVIVACLAAWPISRVQPAARVARDRQVLHFNLLDQTRAFENQVVWASANQSGTFGRLRFPGQSKVVDPDGRVLARTGSRSGMALATIDAATATASVRSQLSHLDDRQPAAYEPAPGPLAPA
jgi:N-carbamoylputrescine amidase